MAIFANACLDVTVALNNRKQVEKSLATTFNGLALGH